MAERILFNNFDQAKRCFTLQITFPSKEELQKSTLSNWCLTSKKKRYNRGRTDEWLHSLQNEIQFCNDTYQN